MDQSGPLRPVLVTGGAGYIGSHTAKVLAQSGWQPIVFDNLSEGHSWATPYGPFVRGDLQDTHALTAAIQKYQPVAAIHFAAFAYVGESMRDPRKYFQNNVVGTLSLLNALLDTGIQAIVFSSTCATYGDPERVPIPEDHPQRPVNPYGETKLEIERALHWYANAYRLRYTALRYFNAAGADPLGEIGEDHRVETHLIPLAILAALGRNKELEVFGTDYPTADGTAVRDYIHVMDLARAHVQALEYLVQGGPSVALNLGTGRGFSVRQVLDEVARVTGKSVPVREGPRRAGDPPALVADPAAARERLGWTAEADLTSIVQTAWRWHAQHHAATGLGPAG